MMDLDELSISRDEVKTILSDLRRDEGLKLSLYRDTEGKLTIGYGHNLSDVGISLRCAEFLLEDDFATASNELDNELPWWKNLNKSHRRGLVNMAFNLGLPKLLKFKKMLSALRQHKGELAATEALDSKWAKQVGARAWRIAALYKKE